MSFFKNLKRKIRMQMAPVAPVQTMPVRKPLGIERLVTRDSNIDFGTGFSKRRGSGGFMPRGDGRLAPISGTLNPGFNMGPKDPQKRTALQDAFAKLQQRLRNQQQPQPLERVDMPSVPQMPTRESIRNYVRNNVDFSRLPRMMMSKGRDANIVDFLNADPEQLIFGIDAQLDELDLELEQAQMNNDRDTIDMIGDEMNDLLFERIKLSNISGDQQRADDFVSALDDNLDMARKRMIDESRRRSSRMGPRSLTPEQQTRLMELKILRSQKPNASTLKEMRSEAKDRRNIDMQMQQRDALDEFLQELEKKN